MVGPSGTTTIYLETGAPPLSCQTMIGVYDAWISGGAPYPWSCSGSFDAGDCTSSEGYFSVHRLRVMNVRYIRPALTRAAEAPSDMGSDGQIQPGTRTGSRSGALARAAAIASPIILCARMRLR